MNEYRFSRLYKETALLIASAAGHTNFVKYFLGGVDPNAALSKNEEISLNTNYSNVLGIHRFDCETKETVVVNLALSPEEYPTVENIRDINNGLTPLMIAWMNRDSKIVKILLDAGAEYIE